MIERKYIVGKDISDGDLVELILRDTEFEILEVPLSFGYITFMSINFYDRVLKVKELLNGKTPCFRVCVHEGNYINSSKWKQVTIINDSTPNVGKFNVYEFYNLILEMENPNMEVVVKGVGGGI
jgi:hypothetical protein